MSKRMAMPQHSVDAFIGTWKHWIDSFVIQDIQKALDRDALEVGLVILTLLGADCLEAYYVGARNGNRSSFERFMKRYFPAPYGPYANLIYCSLRHGLVHRYVVDRVEVRSKLVVPFVLTRDMGEAHLTRCFADDPFPVHLNRAAFAWDFLAVWQAFSSDVDQDP
jgi:hypothetical protein